MTSPKTERHPDTAYCIACEKPMLNGQPYYPDASGGELHAECCGPERECYTSGGEPLADGAPIPAPSIWYEEPIIPAGGAPRPSAAQEMAWNDAPLMSDDAEGNRDALVNGLRYPSGQACSEPAITTDPLLSPDDAAVGLAPLSGRDGTVDCQTCQGSGEIVTDWSRYLKAEPGDSGEEGTADCPDCDGSGRVRLSGKDGSLREALSEAFVAGATAVHEAIKASHPDAVPRGDPEFSEAASDYADAALAAVPPETAEMEKLRQDLAAARSELEKSDYAWSAMKDRAEAAEARTERAAEDERDRLFEQADAALTKVKEWGDLHVNRQRLECVIDYLRGIGAVLPADRLAARASSSGEAGDE